MLRDDAKRVRWCGVDLRARWRRRVAVVGTLLVYLSVMFWAVELKGRRTAFFAMLAAQVWILLLSVFRDGRLTKSFEVKARTGAASRMFLCGLDDWARYEFDVESFEACSEAQQKELLAKYRVGNWVVPRRGGVGYGEPDEREAAERDAAIRRTGNWMVGMISALAGQYVWKQRPVDGVEVGMWLLVITAVLRVGPKAIVLWEESDPREDGEMGVVKMREV